MQIKAINSEARYKAALREAEALMTAKKGSQKGERLDVLATLIEAYEAKRFPLGLPDPIEAIKFRMEQQGLGPKDLKPMLGRLNRVYEVLNRSRPLTLSMIWKLHVGLGIPAESLIKQPADRRAA